MKKRSRSVRLSAYRKGRKGHVSAKRRLRLHHAKGERQRVACAVFA